MQLAGNSHILCGLCVHAGRRLLIENEEIITVLRVMEETLGTLGSMGLHWDRGVSVGVNGSTGNSPIVIQSAPNGNRRTFIYNFMYIFHHSCYFSSTRTTTYIYINTLTYSSRIHNTDTLQSRGTRPIIPAGWVVCMSGDNKWRWIGGSAALSEEQLVLRPSSSADFNWQCSVAWRP